MPPFRPLLFPKTLNVKGLQEFACSFKRNTGKTTQKLQNWAAAKKKELKISSSHKKLKIMLSKISLKLEILYAQKNEMCDVKEANAYTDKKNEAKLLFLVL